jgi:very-short-patch-repair endonuclease
LVGPPRFAPSDVLALTYRYAGARGVRCCRTAVDMMDAGSQSPKETWLRLLLIRAGFPRPQTQIPLYEYGAPVAHLDMGWRSIRVAAEYDGDQHRTDRAVYVKDMRRAELIDRLGWLNVRVVKEDREIDIIGRVRDAWARREREGMAVNSAR